MIIVNGLGCAETGAQIVLKELVKAYSLQARACVFCTNETAKQLIGSRYGRLSPKVWVVGLSHQVFGRWLRIPFEFLIGLAAASRLAEHVINVSHYGAAFSRNYTLYIHNSLLLEQGSNQGWSRGLPNGVKRFLLTTCIKNAGHLIVQSKGMETHLLNFCQNLGINMPRHRVVRPLVHPAKGAAPRREFKFQLFYPTSPFPHKRADLAVGGTIAGAKKVRGVGLVVTVPPLALHLASPDPIRRLGHISREEVAEWYAGSDAILFTSEAEALGLPLLEALANGLPVIAPRLPYATEILADAGCYFDDPSAEGVAAAISDCSSRYAHYKKLTMERNGIVRAHGSTWSDHWSVFMDRSSPVT